MQMHSVVERIRTFIVQSFPRARNVGDDEGLLENDFIDSLGILQVVAFLENEFQITLADEELLPENFNSISNIASFTESKLNGTSPDQMER